MRNSAYWIRGAAPETPRFIAARPESLHFGAAFTAPAIPASESALGSHLCVALSSAQVLPDWTTSTKPCNDFSLNGNYPLTCCLTPGVHFSTISIPIPPNARVERFIPFNEIFPKVDVFVTNGGYGAVQQALCAGVPIVVAGATEDKPFVAARVAWSGAGINLNTDRPTSEQVCNAVRNILGNDEYRKRARTLQTGLAQYAAFKRIDAAVTSALAERQPRRSSPLPHLQNSEHFAERAR